MRIDDALSQVRTIQAQLARTERYCCYRWATVAASGCLAGVAAAAQATYVPYPLLDLREYLLLWIGVAIVSVAVCAAEILFRWQSQSHYAQRQTLAALRQFAPCLLVGAVWTWAIAATSPEHAALLPALWSTCFSLGVFASAAYLPPGGLAVGGYYLLAGLACILWGRGDQALQPWTMVITFGVGQSMAAMILFQRKPREADDGDD
jgi:hypothetical protein